MHACIHCITLHCIAWHGMALHCIAYSMHYIRYLRYISYISHIYIYIYIYIVYTNLQEIHKLHTTYTLQAYCTLHAPHHITSNWKYYITLRYVTLHYVTLRYINIYINYIASHCIGLHIYILPITHTHTHTSFQCIPPRPRRPSGGCSCLRAVGRFSRFFHWQLDCTWVRQKRWLPQIFRFFLGRHVFSGTCEATFLQIHGFKKQSAGLGHGWEKFGCFPLWTPCCDYQDVSWECGIPSAIREDRFARGDTCLVQISAAKGANKSKTWKGRKVFTTRAISCINHAI